MAEQKIYQGKHNIADIDTALDRIATLDSDFAAKQDKVGVATSSANGLMSSADKTKLDFLNITDIELALGRIELLDEEFAEKQDKVGVATSTTDGLMSADDKRFIDNLSIDSINAAIERIATLDDELAAKQDVLSDATTNESGLMSCDDKENLDNLMLERGLKCRLQVQENKLYIISDCGAIKNTDEIVLYRYMKHRNNNKNSVKRTRKKGWYEAGTYGPLGGKHYVSFRLSVLDSLGSRAVILPVGYTSFDAYQKYAHNHPDNENVFLPYLEKRCGFAIRRNGRRITDFLRFTMALHTNNTWYFCPWHSNQ